MKLWTIQTIEVYEEIIKNGVYHCDPGKSDLLKPFDYDLENGHQMNAQFFDAYSWMAFQMRKRIGEPPNGVIFPVWAWFQYDKERKPDLRRERWSNGCPGETLVCINIDIDDSRVLLSDFSAWHHVLNKWPLSYTEKVECIDNGWTSRGSDIQATFWELKKEDIVHARYFKCGAKSNTNLISN